MADLAQIEKALRAADAAGHAEDAKALAQAYQQARSQQPAPAVAPQQRSTSAGVDMVRSVPGGVAKGTAGLLGLPGDVRDLVNAGAGWVNNKLSPGSSGRDNTANLGPVTHALMLPIGPAGPASMLPDSRMLNEGFSKATGGYYKPKTTAGKYAETVASFAPNAIAPGSLAARAARVVVPGVASEAAGQATKGKSYEPLARAVGALLGGLGVGAVEGALAIKPIMSAEELLKAKDAAYKAADDAGVIVSPKSFQKFATDLGSDITKKNVVQADIHPNTLAAIKVVQEEAAAGAPISLTRADAIRKAVNGAVSNAVKNGNNDDVRIAQQVKEGLDKFLDNLTPADTISGDASIAVPILKEARGLAQREFKSDKIQELIDLAENAAGSNYSASGFEQALRAQFKQFNAQLIKNPNLAKTFTAAERKAIERVIQGGPIGNTLRYFGKLAPTGVVSAAGGAYLGNALGGPIGGAAGAGAGAVAAPILGGISRKGAEAITMRNANAAGALMRAGPQGPGAVPANKMPRDLILNALLSQQAAH